MTFQPYPDLPQLHAALADWLAELIRAKPVSEGAFHLALPGGNTPLAFFKYWSLACPDFPWERLQVWWGDERCVAPDDSRSNFFQAQHAFLTLAQTKGLVAHRMHGEQQPARAASLYGMEIEENLPRTATGVPLFDLVLLGMGPDGHVASWFPSVAVQAVHPWVGVSQSPDGLPRLTLTPEVLASAAHVALLVTGSAKRPLLESVLEGSGATHTLPVAILTRKRPDIRWFVSYNS